MDVNSSYMFRCIVKDIPGAEGPVFSKDGTFYMVAPEREDKEGRFAGQILRVSLDTGAVTVVCEPNLEGNGGIPAGCQGDRENNLWVADMRLGILKVKPDGSFEQVSRADSEGACLQGCNDCIFDYEGNLWVTAPAGEIAPHPYRRSSEEAFGSVYCLTKQGQLHKIDTGYLFSNGIAVQHDSSGRPSKLIVAETFTKSLWGYDIIGNGKVTNKHLWGKLPGEQQGGADGMDFDEEGNLLVAHHGGGHIEVYGPSGGSPISRIVVPFKTPSNIHFRPDSKELYVTEHDTHGLWMTQWRCKGMKQFCDL